METVDLYQIHRWDPDTPIEQTLRTPDDTVRRGKIRYIGASSIWAHQFAETLHMSDSVGLNHLCENHYNLVYRKEERKMVLLCNRENIEVIP